jgi:hypothetical protein
MEKLKTPRQIRTEIKQRKIAEEWLSMVTKGSSKTAVAAFLRKKYGIDSDTTIVNILIKYGGRIVKHRVKKS